MSLASRSVPSRRRLPRPLAASIAALLLAGSVQGQIAWSPTPADNAWTNVANWVGGNVPNTNTEQALFDASAVTAINLSATITVNKATFNAAAPAYTFSGSQLILDVNTTAGTATALDVLAGAGPVTFDNSVNFRDSNGNNGQPIISVGTGTVVDFNAAISTTSNRNLAVSGSGTVNFNANSLPALGSGQLQQNGSATIRLFSNPASVGQIRTFGKAGSIQIHADVNRSLGLGVTGGNLHEGRIYLAADGVITSGPLSTGGGSGTGTNTMDITFGADIPGSGTATHSGSFALNGVNAGLTGTTGLVRLDVASDDTLLMTGAISGIAAGYTEPEFRKQGPGTAILTGANTYTLPTRVEEGTLVLTPAQTGNVAMTVDDGATLGVRLQTAGTLNLANLSVGTTTGSTLHFDTLGLGNPLVPMINTAAFDPLAATTLAVTGSNLTSGTFRLIDYTSIAVDGFSRLSLQTPFRIDGQLVDAVDGAVDATLTVNTPRWNGDLSGNWDINDGVAGGTQNWRTLTSNAVTHYIQGANTDIVLFNDDAQGTTVVNLTTTLTPVGATVANNTLPYTFTGPGKISGAGSLTKTGTGTLVLANTATYDHSGGTFVNDGTLQVGDGVTPAAGFLPEGIVVNNATIVLNRPDDFAVASLLSGTGTIVKNQANTATFTAPVNFGGGIDVDSGELHFTAGGNLGGAISGDGELEVDGGTLQLSGASPTTLSGRITVRSGTLQLNKPAGTDAVTSEVLLTGTGALTRSQANQIADTATVLYDKAINGGSLILNETIGTLTMLNGNDTGAQVQGQTGFVVTGLLTAQNTSVFSVQSNHSSAVGGLNISGTAIIRVPANSNPSTLTVNALGITASGGTIQVGQGTGAHDAVLNLNGDVTTTGNLNFTDGNFTGAQLRQINLGGVRTFDIGALTTTTVAPDFAGAGGLTKTGEGTLTLTAASTSTHTGATTISAGTLLLNGSLSGTNILIDGGTLAGIGSITTGLLGLDVIAGGKIAPGPVTAGGIGTLTIDATGSEGDLSGAGLGSLLFDLSTPALSDKVAVTGGTLQIGSGTLGFGTFNFNELAPFSEGDVFPLFETGQVISGSLSGDISGPLQGGLIGELRISGDGTDLVLAVVPEPGISALLLAGAGALSFRRKRR